MFALIKSEILRLSHELRALQMCSAASLDQLSVTVGRKTHKVLDRSETEDIGQTGAKSEASQAMPPQSIEIDAWAPWY